MKNRRLIKGAFPDSMQHRRQGEATNRGTISGLWKDARIYHVIKYQSEAIDLAPESIEDQFRSRLRLYQSGKPCREEVRYNPRKRAARAADRPFRNRRSPGGTGERADEGSGNLSP